MAAIFAAGLNAQPVAQTNAGVPTGASAVSAPTAPVPAGPEEKMVPSAAPELFNVFGFPVTNSMICTWIVAAVILIVVRATTWKNIKEIPSGMQNVIEAMVEGWDGLIGDILDKTRRPLGFSVRDDVFHFHRHFKPDGFGSGRRQHRFGEPTNSRCRSRLTMSRPFFRPPTTDANLTVAMAGIFLVMSLYWAVRYNGFFGLVKHIFGVKMETNKWLYPLFFLLFIFIGAMELLSDYVCAARWRWRCGFTETFLRAKAFWT